MTSDASVAAADRTRLVKARALELGFDSVGVTDLSPPPHAESLRGWLESGMAGTMTYMNRQARKRLDPSLIFPGATRAVVLTRNYHPGHPDSDAIPGTGLVAKYARGRDYHEALRGSLDALSESILAHGDGSTVARAFLDAGPVPERELAQRAGLGWIGKNTMLLDPVRGSFFFLAAVLTNLDLEPDQPFTSDHCGTCRACIDACPTGALVNERILDARRCISYLTIELRGEIAPELAASVSDLVFGCDICQDVCPWNQKFATTADDSVLEQDPTMQRLELGQFTDMTVAEFDQLYGGTPLERPKLEGMRRNAAVALRNTNGDVER